MSVAPEHAPTIQETSFIERLAPHAPLLLVPVLIVLGFLSIANPSSWLTLTVSGLAMGMMIFIMGVPGMGTGLEVRVLYGASW